ncbi:caspase family protein [Streptomyces sp. 8L]|uniref:caspase family protein n=1 Tax=Streptomyces sp. 8L TaxID=2877242 RepID=UPI001CD4C3DB|nr:caspase family protein [Streptomyces sp. 8L]MCA1219061.1 caspase family protein [Streptomyces sp. 8L]
MSDVRLPDGARSRAVLLGVSRFADGRLPPLPSVRENLTGLWGALTHPVTGLLPPAHCRTVADPTDPRAVGEALSWAAGEADDLLLVYYAGHGVLDDGGLLHLAVGSTVTDHVGYSAVPVGLVKRTVTGARAANRVLIVDCCFSGQALTAMSGTSSLVLGQLDLTGTYTLTSTPETAPALAPAGDRYTAYTGALLSALDSPGPRSLDDLHRDVHRNLIGRGLPEPQRMSSGDTGLLALSRGTGPRTAAGAAGTGTRPGGPPPQGSGGWGEPPVPRPAEPAEPAAPVAPRARRAALVTVSALAFAAAAWGVAAAFNQHETPDPGPSPSVSDTAHHARTGSTSPKSPASQSPSPVDTVVYRDKEITWPAADCGDTGYQVLDLDLPGVSLGHFNGLDTSGKDGDLAYHGCADEDEESAGALEPNTDSDPQVHFGTAGPGVRTAAQCADAARTGSLGALVLARDVKQGASWCVTTNGGHVAKLTFKGIGAPYRHGLQTSPRNPTFRLTVTLWKKPAESD